MKEHFEKQLENATPLTEEMIELFIGKTDYFDAVLEPDHIMLSCILQTDNGLDEDTGERNLNLKMIRITDASAESTLKENYEFVRIAGDITPVFKLKEEA